MNSAEFVERFLLDEVKSMQRAGVQLQLLAAMVHGIETAGALLDDKPFKAKGQGKKRFELALKKLFPNDYYTANISANFYGQLRSHMAHCMLPAKSMLIADEGAHLTVVNNQWQIVLNTFFADYETAMNKLLNLLGEGKLKNKRIDFSASFG